MDQELADRVSALLIAVSGMASFLGEKYPEMLVLLRGQIDEVARAESATPRALSLARSVLPSA